MAWFAMEDIRARPAPVLGPDQGLALNLGPDVPVPGNRVEHGQVGILVHAINQTLNLYHKSLFPE